MHLIVCGVASYYRLACTMSHEERIRDLCERVIAAQDEAEISALADELRWVLHERVEELRSHLPVLSRMMGEAA